MSKRIAVIGSGISGLAAAYHLGDCADVTLFEAEDYFGGHAHTVDVRVSTRGATLTQAVDTGFLVFNERTYPKLIALLKMLNVPTAASDMSFSVNVPHLDLEWSGSNLNTVFAQRRNLFRPQFWQMLRDILRFNKLASAAAKEDTPASLTVENFLAQHRFSKAFQDGYLLPMIACIWSCPTHQMLKFPLATLIRFCDNHGLIQVANRPRWFTIAGGAKLYVAQMTAKISDARLNTPVRRIHRQEGQVRISTDAGTELFDHVVLACHSDQALKLLSQPTQAEREVLSAIRYHNNQAVLHTDTAMLPKHQRAWAAWNYERSFSSGDDNTRVCLHYLINRLQPLPFETPVVVSLNPIRAPRADLIQGVFDYSHPIFDAPAIEAQGRVPALQGVANTWFCGAWTHYGFHEDGLTSGLAVAHALRPLCEQALEAR